MKKTVITILLVLILIFSAFPASAFAAYADTEEHWGKTQINEWTERGIFTGADGLFRPDDPMTRGELAVILDRIMHFVRQTPNTFSDLDSTFYTEALLKANAAGIIMGDKNKMRPTDVVTREETMVMLGRVLGLSPDVSYELPYEDKDAISPWAVGYIKAMVSRGYGIEWTLLKPQTPVSRAEVVTMLDNSISELMSKPGEYTGDLENTVIVNVPGVILKDMKITGDLIVSEGVGNGDITLNNVSVTGNMIIRGGSADSVHLEGNSHLNNMIIQNGDHTATVSIAGTVYYVPRDASSSIVGVPGVTVSVITGTSVIASGTTGADGKYRIDSVPAGAYSLEFSAEGYNSYTLSSVQFTSSSGTNDVMLTKTVSFGSPTYDMYDIAGVYVEDKDANHDKHHMETLTVNIISSSHTEGVSVKLRETEADSGVFAGALSIIPYDISESLYAEPEDIITVSYKNSSGGTEKVYRDTAVVTSSVSARIGSVSATNGAVVITLRDIPTVSPAAEDFAAEYVINSGVAAPLFLTDFSYDGNITVTFGFTPIAAASSPQSVVVKVTGQTASGRYSSVKAPEFLIPAAG
jgi:hypothetical protein